jgi:hypothetical protein
MHGEEEIHDQDDWGHWMQQGPDASPVAPLENALQQLHMSDHNMIALEARGEPDDVFVVNQIPDFNLLDEDPEQGMQQILQQMNNGANEVMDIIPMGPVSMELWSFDLIGNNSNSSIDQEIVLEDHEIVLALPAEPINFSHNEIHPHEWNVDIIPHPKPQQAAIHPTHVNEVVSLVAHPIDQPELVAPQPKLMAPQHELVETQIFLGENEASKIKS